MGETGSRVGAGIAAAAAVAGVSVGVAAGAAWLWRNQADIATRRPFNEWTFTHMSALLPTQAVPRACTPRPLPRGTGPLPVTYEYRGEKRTLARLHAATETTGFAVVHRGVLVHEAYPGVFAHPRARFQLFSLTKSVTALLVGVALKEGDIDSLQDPAVTYCPRLAGTAYAGATVEDLLRMCSGAGDERLEDYADPDAVINDFERTVTAGGSLWDVIRRVPATAAPGARFNYSTLDSQVLGWVLESAVGMPIADYAARRLWGPIGAQDDAYYFLTRGRPRTALGGGSLNASVRDMAKVGLLMARDGVVAGERILPEGWVERARGAGLAHLEVGALGPTGAPHYGYSDQWWTLGGDRRAFTGLGIHGQYLWVDPQADVVVVKTSAWPTADDEDRDDETVAAMRAIVAFLEER
ncbi:serine hydrolase domain-containing protein [Nocardiopsis protaetiae]|uniref:serine hydrolase domain-containing protein n=1 Tax=Nocardiopsis protaetiae TaxID=3382270 RepID=UPI00387B9895